MLISKTTVPHNLHQDYVELSSMAVDKMGYLIDYTWNSMNETVNNTIVMVTDCGLYQHHNKINIDLTFEKVIIWDRKHTPYFFVNLILHLLYLRTMTLLS